MEPTAEPRAQPAEAVGELVIRNGPHSGLRRALVGPLTFIGRAEWCDLRVDAEAVSPWHCVVARGEDGLVLRDLHSDAGTRVNGQAASACPLRDGDVLSVGPVELLVRWNGGVVRRAGQAGEDAGGRRQAARLDEKRQQLLRLRDDVRGEHEALAKERARYEERVALVQQELARDRQAMAERQKGLRTQ